MKSRKLYSMYTLLCLMVAACQTEPDMTSIDKSDPEIQIKNGVLHYKSAPYNCLLLTYYPDRSLKSKAPYTKGRKQGVERHWFENGMLALERPYSKGIKTGVHRAWWIEGNLKFEYHFNEDGAYHGQRREWYTSGQLFRDFNYDNGQETGSQRLWKLNGNIKANYTVYLGDRFGLIGLKKCATVSDTPKKL